MSAATVYICQSTIVRTIYAISIGRSGKPDADRLSECTGGQPFLRYSSGWAAGDTSNGAARAASLALSTVHAEQWHEKYFAYCKPARIGASIFNAAQAFITIQRSKNLSATLSYTFSKLMGNTTPLLTGFLNANSANGNPDIQNSYHIQDKEWSILSTDVPHRFVANANYSLPFGRGQRFGGDVSGWMNEVIGGWKLNTIVSVQSGYTLGITQTGGQTYSGARPFFVPGGKPLHRGMYTIAWEARARRRHIWIQTRFVRLRL